MERELKWRRKRLESKCCLAAALTAMTRNKMLLLNDCDPIFRWLGFMKDRPRCLLEKPAGARAAFDFERTKDVAHIIFDLYYSDRKSVV